MKKTVIIGATPNPSRYAFLVANMLKEGGIDFVPIGIKKGEVAGREILDLRSKPPIEGVHTVTLYVGPRHQPEWYDYILSLKASRVIFNPGAENSEFERMVEDAGAEAWEACTMVLLRSGQY